MAETSSWLKQNLVLVAGIVLPVIIVAVFGVAALVPKLTVEPPKYAVLFTDYREYAYDRKRERGRVEVVDKKVRLTIHPETEDNKYAQSPRIFLYDPVKDSVKEITYDSSKKDENNIVPLKELENVTVDTNNTSPDGYEFVNDYSSRRHGGLLLGDMFGGGYRSHCVLQKEGNVVRIRQNRDAYYYGCYSQKFLGWVMPQ